MTTQGGFGEVSEIDELADARREAQVALDARNAIANVLKNVTLERDTLRTMVVSIYQFAQKELRSRRAMPFYDAQRQHEIEVLNRFVVDARKHVELIQQVEAGNVQQST